MPIAVPRSEMGAKIETSAGSIVSSAVKPAKNSTRPRPSAVKDTAHNAITNPITVSQTLADRQQDLRHFFDALALALDLGLELLDGGGELGLGGGLLLVGGAGVALGYHRRPDLTAERFVPYPAGAARAMASGPGLVYRTGDVVRRRAPPR